MNPDDQECWCGTDWWCRKHDGEPPVLPVSPSSPEPEKPLLVKLASWLLDGLKR